MWTSGGQIDLLTFAGMRGGKGGGGGDPTAFQSRPVVLTDPVNGKTFVQETNPNLTQGQPQGKSAQDQLNEEIADRQRQEKAASDQAAAEKAAQDQFTRDQFNIRTKQATDLARQGANTYFTNQGLDPNQYGDQISAAIARSAAGIKDLDPNPSSAFDPNLGQSVFNDLTSGTRARATSQVSNLFTPTYAQDRLSYGAADPLINDILNEQFNPLQSSLVSARDRGTLTPLGFQAANDTLAQKRAAAQSQVGTIAHGIIDTDRTSINDLISGAKNTAGGLTLNTAGAFDPTSFRTQADAKINSELGDLGGAIRSGIGGTKFTDITELLNAGGSAQGATQPSITNPNGALDPNVLADQQRKQQPRGLGTQGAF